MRKIIFAAVLAAACGCASNPPPAPPAHETAAPAPAPAPAPAATPAPSHEPAKNEAAAPERPQAPSPRDQARIAAARANIKALIVALETFELDTGRYPSTAEGLQALVQQPAGLQGWSGPYIQGPVPKDPWANPFVYLCPGKHNPASYDLYSADPAAKDGVRAGVDNWTEK